MLDRSDDTATLASAGAWSVPMMVAAEANPLEFGPNGPNRSHHLDACNAAASARISHRELPKRTFWDKVTNARFHWPDIQASDNWLRARDELEARGFSGYCRFPQLFPILSGSTR